MTENLALKSFRLKNFKAVRDSDSVRFTPLTVLIGDNGSGKSSLIEGLQTYQRIVTNGLDEAMQMWGGFEQIRNAAVVHQDQITSEGRDYQTNPIEFRASHWLKEPGKPSKGESQSHLMSVTSSPDGDEIFFFEERWTISGKKIMTRNKDGEIFDAAGKPVESNALLPVAFPAAIGSMVLRNGESLIGKIAHYPSAAELIASWQFVMLNAYAMGYPQPQQRTGGSIRLRSDGSNIAEYLNDIRQRDSAAFKRIIETLQYVLPYVSDLQPTLTSELERAVYLQMTEEEDFKVPGWLLSTGTLRILALLALFNHPEPPPLIVIEEIENGLDPRTIHLIVEELRSLVENNRAQVIVTTHSPYLLDLLALSHIVLVERVDGGPTFFRPAGLQELEGWARRFSPGRLYTMEKLSRREYA